MTESQLKDPMYFFGAIALTAFGVLIVNDILRRKQPMLSAEGIAARVAP